jgi:hypothetical protein
MLLERKIPKSDILLPVHSPIMRADTEYAENVTFLSYMKATKKRSRPRPPFNDSNGFWDHLSSGFSYEKLENLPNQYNVP